MDYTTTTGSTTTDWYYTTPNWQINTPNQPLVDWQQLYDGVVTTTTPLVWEEKKENKNMMKVFEVIVIDKKECEILSKQHVIAKDKETAMLDLNLTPEVRKKVKKNLIEFIFSELGSFTREERRITVKEYEDGNDED